VRVNSTRVVGCPGASRNVTAPVVSLGAGSGEVGHCVAARATGGGVSGHGAMHRADAELAAGVADVRPGERGGGFGWLTAGESAPAGGSSMR